MPLHLQPFSVELAGVVSSWAHTDEEVLMCGELWVDDDEAEVEVARLIVDPAERGQGLGRNLAAGLARRAQALYPCVFLRIHPSNIAALRCYAGAGFESVGADQAAAWNVGQPVNYIWLSPASERCGSA